MWPMSHALYPGLNNDKLERPSTSDSHKTAKTWYGNNRKSYASSTFSFHSDKRSVHSLARETGAPGEDLGDLINHSRRVLSELSVDADKESQLDQARQSAASRGNADSNNNMMNKDNEPVAHGEERCPGPEEALAALEGEEAETSSHRTSTGPSSPRSPGPRPPSSVSRLSQSSKSQNAETILSSTASVVASNKAGSDIVPAGSSTPGGDTTAAPSISLGCENSSELEKKPEVVHVKPLIPDYDRTSQRGSRELGPERDQEKSRPEEQVEEEEDEDDPTANHLTGLPLVSVTIALSAAVFLVAMDVNVIATAIPRITGEFRSLEDVGWYGSAFLMATCAAQIPYGRIYSLFPAKWVFTSAIMIFMAGSLIAALSPSSPILILGRSVQGLGTSGILSGGLIILGQVVPLRLRPLLTSCIGVMEGVAMISAPVIGGVLTDNLNWRWCFYINLPIGGFTLIVVLVCLRNLKGPRKTGTGRETLRQTLYKLDVLGAVILLPPVVCVLLGLHIAGTDGHSFSDNDVILLLVLGVVLFGIFAYSQHRNAEVAILPFRVTTQRSVLAGFWFITCTSSALVVITYFLPLWFQIIKATSAQESGIGILPMLVGVISGVLGTGAVISIVGYYTPFMIVSSILMPIGLGLLTTIGPDTPRAALLGYPAVFGIGVGLGFQQPLIGVQTVLPQADVAAGTSVIVFGQTFGAAIMIAIGETVFQSRLLANLDSYLGITDVNTHELLGNGPASLPALVPTEKLPRLIEAVNASLTQTFFVALALAVLSVFGSVFMEWKSVKQQKPAAEGDEGVAAVVRSSSTSLRAAC